jgi:hypothetical protein
LWRRFGITLITSQHESAPNAKAPKNRTGVKLWKIKSPSITPPTLNTTWGSSSALHLLSTCHSEPNRSQTPSQFRRAKDRLHIQLPFPRCAAFILSRLVLLSLRMPALQAAPKAMPAAATQQRCRRARDRSATCLALSLRLFELISFRSDCPIHYMEIATPASSFKLENAASRYTA